MFPRRFLLCLLLWVPAAAFAQGEWFTDLDPVIRERGMRAARRSGETLPESVGLRLLGDPDWGVQLEAIETFGTRSEPAIREALIQLCAEGDLLRIRRAAAVGLASGDRDAAAKRLIPRARANDKKTKARALEALGLLGSPVATDVLSGAARDPDEDICRVALVSLGQLAVGAGAVAQALEDRREAVSLPAAAAAARFDDDGARTALLKWVQRHDEPWALRRAARAYQTNPSAFGRALANAIEKAKAPRNLLRVAWEGKVSEAALAARLHLKAEDPLARGYAFLVAGLAPTPLDDKDLQRGLMDRDVRVKECAARAHVSIGLLSKAVGESLPPLLLHESPEVALIGIRAAFEQRVEGAVPGLLKLVEGDGAGRKSWEVRSAAAVAAGAIGQAAALPALVSLAGESDWHVRAAVLEGISRTGRPGAMPPLIKAFDDRHPVARYVARRNLFWLTGGREFSTQEEWGKWWEQAKEAFVPTVAPSLDPPGFENDGYDRAMPTDYARRLLSGTDVTVILGRWDRVQLVLQNLNVEHQLLRGQEYKERGTWPKETIVVNCEGSMDKAAHEALRWAVVCGASLATSDWALTNALKKTFPEVLEGHVRQSTGNDLVPVESTAPEHPLMRDVLRPHVDYTWWLEIQAFPISVEDPMRATVLVDSLDMRLKYGQDTMMVTFPAGLGQVLHTTSHFYLQEEGFLAGSSEERERFAVDHLGITVSTIRAIRAGSGMGDARSTPVLARDYSMFRMLLNLIREQKARDRR